MTQENSFEVFSEGYLRELDERIARSELIGTVVLKDRSVALFYDADTAKFAMLEKIGTDEAVSVFDAVPREQWGRLVMVFGHQTNTGGYIASGHGTLTGDQFTIRLANGRYYRLTVDPTLPHLAPYFVQREPAKPKVEQPLSKKPNHKNGGDTGNAEHAAELGTRPVRARRQERHDRKDSNRASRGDSAPMPSDSNHAGSDEHEDFDEDDLARLRGEMPMAARKNKRRR